MKKRYKQTSSNQKRSLVRSLNTFSKQYENIICKEEFIDLNIESMTLIYSDDMKSENIIFNKSEALIDLKNTQLILDTVDNLISINRKNELKSQLKDAIKRRDYNGINGFFNNEIISISQINEIVDNEKFAQKLFNQIKSRIQFRRSGIYINNNQENTITNKVQTSPTTQSEIINKQFQFIIDNLYLFEEEFISKVDEVNNTIENENEHNSFNSEYIPTNDNTSYFHPIDEETFLNEDSTLQTRESAMTNAMIDKENFGLYNKEVYDDYYSFASNYNEDSEIIKEYIEIMIHYYEMNIEIEKDLFTIDELLYDDFIEYRKEKVLYKKTQLKNKLLSYKDEYDDLSKLEEFLSIESVLEKIKQYKDIFYKIVNRVEVAMLNITHKQYLDFIEIQDLLLNEFNVDSLYELREIEKDILLIAHYEYNLGADEDELLFIIYHFDREDSEYQFI